MKTVCSDAHLAHCPVGELAGGEFVRPFECPERWTHIVRSLRARELFDPVEPDALDTEILQAVHDRGYLAFLESAWDDWIASGAAGEAIPTVFPVRGLQRRKPHDIDGRLGYYALAAETAITGGTWSAATASAAIAQSAARRVADGDAVAFALCRPPGHHAHADLFGGYCFLNNAALAAIALRGRGASRVAILDVDFHHGNGTQAIFYARSDVLVASLHGRPEDAFPHFLGYADETGTGPGEGFNLNLPLPRGTGWSEWSLALEHALERIARYGAEALVVSLGVDTFEHDPISFFRLRSDDYRLLGERLGRVGLPTVFVMEGGYAVDAIGDNVANVLSGHLSLCR